MWTYNIASDLRAAQTKTASKIRIHRRADSDSIRPTTAMPPVPDGARLRCQVSSETKVFSRRLPLSVCFIVVYSPFPSPVPFSYVTSYLPSPPFPSVFPLLHYVFPSTISELSLSTLSYLSYLFTRFLYLPLSATSLADIFVAVVIFPCCSFIFFLSLSSIL